MSLSDFTLLLLDLQYPELNSYIPLDQFEIGEVRQLLECRRLCRQNMWYLELSAQFPLVQFELDIEVVRQLFAWCCQR